MVVAQINAVCGSGSTGKICVSLSDLSAEYGIDNYILYNNGSAAYSRGCRYNTEWQLKKAALASRLWGNWGFEGASATKQLIQKLEELQPDLLHLHNLHSHACRLDMLFGWIKERNIKVLWTFHDCWAFTGYCMYYDAAGCDRWKTACGNCPQKKQYSWFFDKSHSLYTHKKKLFKKLDLTIITPSQWLANQVKMSFLRDYPVKVIHNGIDLAVFCPSPSDFRRRYALENKKIVLGVAMIWEQRKGLDVFAALANRLGDDYRVVLVGGYIPEGALPDGVLHIPRTKNQRELAEVYTAADVFANPTREDNFPTANLEALACGTPVISFDTGGSPECIDATCGAVVPQNDIDTLEREIHRVCEKKPFSSDACVAKAKQFDAQDRFAEYIRLYQGG